VLHLLDLEVRRGEADGSARPLAAESVTNGLLHVEGEGIAELVGLVLGGPLVTGAGPFDLVAAEAVLGQLGEEFRQCPLADAAQALRRQLVSPVAGVDQPGLLQRPRQAGQLLEALGGLVTEERSDPVEIGLGQLGR